jgi:hypothetical protein
MFDSTCTSTVTPEQVVYFMQVACSSQDIYVFNDKEYEFKKSSVGMIIIFNDIIIVVVLFLLVAFHKWNQDVIAEELDKEQITARDFGVEIRNLPPNKMSANQFRAEMWHWIESNMKEHGEDMACPDGLTLDTNQDKVMNIYFAMHEFGRMRKLLNLQELYNKEKTLQHKMSAYPQNMPKYLKQQNKID